MRITLLAPVVLLIVSFAAACGGDGTAETEGSGSGGASGSAGAGGIAVGSGGGAGSGGDVAGAGGAAGASGTGGSGVGGGGGGTGAGHCSPGTPYPENAAWNGKLQQCDRYDGMANGLGTGGYADVREIIPPEPLVAGTPFSVSVGVKAAGPGQTVEFWGGGSSCGRAEEKLYTGPMAAGTVCANMTPAQGHETLLMVWPGSGSLFISDITVCMHGTCP